ncbi:MAG: hypothetical protein K1Y36_05915 [Blastocatellia bacterium]|nr:hypothetical protein [Blastocatellia bacterium]
MNKKKILLLVWGGLLIVTGWLWWTLVRRPTPVNLAELVPEHSLLYFEAQSLPDLYRAVTQSHFWQESCTALNVPDQFLYVGQTLDWLEGNPLGPDELVIGERAQIGLTVSGFELERVPALQPGEPLETSLTLRGTLLLKTHTTETRTQRFCENRLPLLARKIFGSNPVRETLSLENQAVQRFRAQGSEKALWAGCVGDLILISNDEASLKACLASATRQAAGLAATGLCRSAQISLKHEEATCFGFITPTGVGRLAALGLALVVPKFGQSEAELVTQAVSNVNQGIAFSTMVENGLFVDKSIILLQPDLVDGLRPLVQVTATENRIREVLPADAASTSIVNLSRPGSMIDAVHAYVSAHSNVAVSFALRQALNGLGETFGINPKETIGDAFGTEFGLVKFRQSESTGWVLQTRNRVRLLPTVDRYLRFGNATLENQTYRGLELAVSSHPDQRTAVFLGDFLILAPLPAVKHCCDAFLDGKTLAQQGIPSGALPTGGSGVSFLRSIDTDPHETEMFILLLAKISRAGDATPRRLNDPKIKDLLQRVPPATSVVELHSDGIYSETRSAVGRFGRLAAFFGPEPSLTPTITPN